MTERSIFGRADASRFVEEAPGPAIATDSENRILGLNRAARQLLGYDSRKALGRNLHRLVQARDTFGNRLSGEPFAFFEMVSLSEPVGSFDIEVRKASGDPLRVAVSVIVMLGSSREDYSLVYQLRPIYRRRKADEAIERILASRGSAEESPLTLRGTDTSERASDLTPRQIEVLRLMARGASAQETATTLGISVNTARTHIQRILRRLGVHSQLEAVAVAFRQRLI
jgi:DNA-binding CsgD family transcriptional regulator